MESCFWQIVIDTGNCTVKQIAIMYGIVQMQIAIYVWNCANHRLCKCIGNSNIEHTLNWKLYSGIKSLYFSVENCSSNPM